MAQCSSSSVNVPNKLISSLFAQKNANSYCDITLKFGEVELKAHSCVVAAFSPFVDNFLSSGEVMPPSTSTSATQMRKFCLMPLSDAKFKCLDCANKVIDFMYLGKIQIDDGHLEHIKVVSESLQVSELLKICRKHSDKRCDHMKGADDLEETLISSDSVTEEPAAEELRIPSKAIKLDSREMPAPVQQIPCERTILSGDVSSLPINSVPASDDMDESEWSGMKCPKCDLVLMSLALYQQHCGTHLGKTYTTCYVCNYASIRVPDVIKHLQEQDHGEKVCSICLLEVNCSQTLKEHIQIHDQAQPFFCLTCSTRFQTRTALNSHIVRHTNETPFICKECGRGFKWKHGLRSHMVTHSKLKSFLCDQCGFSTAHLRSFIDHKAAHSGEKFKCPKPDCQFSSVRRASVKHHLMTHSKQKPYQCEVCGQAFSQNKNLRRHAALHNPSADPEKCPLCSYQTNRSDKFKAHFKRYHKDGESLEDQLGINRKLFSSSSSSLPRAIPEQKNVSNSDAIHGAIVNKDIDSTSAMLNSKYGAAKNVSVKKQSAGKESMTRCCKSNTTLKVPAVHAERICFPSLNKIIQKQKSKSAAVTEEKVKTSPDKQEASLSKLASKENEPHYELSAIVPNESSENILLQVSNPISKQFVVLNTDEAVPSSDALYAFSDRTYVLMDVAGGQLAENVNLVDASAVVCDSIPLNIITNGASMSPSVTGIPVSQIFDKTVHTTARKKS